MRQLSRLLIAILFLLILCPRLRADDDRHAADLLPATVGIYVEVPQPKELLGQIIDHPIYQKLSEADTYKQALQQPQFVQLRGAVALVELRIGRTWRSALEALFDKGIVVAVDVKTKGVAIVTHSSATGLVDQTRDVILSFIGEDAKKKGNADPTKAAEYRGIKAYQIDKGKFATFDGWVVVTNNDDLGKNIIDRYLDRTADSLATSQRFQQARQQISPEAVAWSYADVETIRATGASPDVFGGKAKDPGGELILGGLLANLSKTPFATAELKLDQQQASLVLRSPHDVSWIGEGREYYFGPQGTGRAPQLLQAPNTVMALSSYRDVSGMWLRAGDLFNKEVNDQLASADSTLTTLFSGRDFGEDILGAIKPELQLIVVRQTFEEGRPQPSIRLPAFALVAQLKEPEKMRPELRRIFQSLIGFLNITGAMNGQPQLDLNNEQNGGNQLVTATYAVEVDRPNQTEAKLNYNFSPSLAFADNYVILSSTTPLARQLIDSAKNTSATSGEALNTRAAADAKVLRDILQDNRSHLIAQNMLQSGHSHDEAEKEIDTLLSILQLLRGVELRFKADDHLQLELNVNLSSTQ